MNIGYNIKEEYVGLLIVLDNVETSTCDMFVNYNLRTPNASQCSQQTLIKNSSTPVDHATYKITSLPYWFPSILRKLGIHCEKKLNSMVNEYLIQLSCLEK